MDLSLTRDGGPVGETPPASSRARDRARPGRRALHNVPRFVVSNGPGYRLGTRFSCRGSEREPNRGEEFFVVKRLGHESRSPGVQCS